MYSFSYSVIESFSLSSKIFSITCITYHMYYTYKVYFLQKLLVYDLSLNQCICLLS